MTSGMTDRDKAAEYDRIAAYLRKNGWSVVREWQHPVDGTMHEHWRHKDDASKGECDLMGAFTIERWKDAPKQGVRMAHNLEALNRVIDAKQEAAREPDQLDDLYQRSQAKYETLGKPGPALPWHEDEHGGWHRMLTGSERVVATVDKYPSDLGEGYFYCVGDGPSEVSSDEEFDSVDAAKVAADARLKTLGYTFREMD